MSEDTRTPKTEKTPASTDAPLPTEQKSTSQKPDRADRLHRWLESAITIGLHITPIIAVFITWSLSARAFGHTGDHLGLLAIELSFLLIASALTLGFIRGKKHTAAAWVSVALLVAIIGMNCATGFYTSDDGYLQPNAPSYLATWRTHALAWTPIISIALAITFAALDGKVQDKIGAATFKLWKAADERKTEQITKRAEATTARLNAQANAEQQTIPAVARMERAAQMKRSVREQARSADFKKTMDERAVELLNNTDEIDKFLQVATGAGNPNG